MPILPEIERIRAVIVGASKESRDAIGHLGHVFEKFEKINFLPTYVDADGFRPSVIPTVGDADIFLIEYSEAHRERNPEFLSSVKKRIRKFNQYIRVGLLLTTDKSEILKDALHFAGCVTIIVPDDDPEGVYIKGIADRIREVAQRYYEIKQRMEDNLKNGTVKKSGTDAATKEQIDLLRYVEPTPLAKYFPTVRNWWTENRDGKVAYVYEMDYFEMPSMRTLVLSSTRQQTDKPLLQRVVEKVLDILFSEIATHRSEVRIPDGFLEKSFTSRFQDRRKIVIDGLNVLKRLEREDKSTLPSSNVFRVLFETNKDFRCSCDENGEPGVWVNPEKLLRRLLADEGFRKRMTPPRLFLIHGDLHFRNILADTSLYRQPRVKLIDPRGFQYCGLDVGMGDIAYDLGKLFMSTHGKYDVYDDGYGLADIEGCRSDGTLAYRGLSGSTRVDHNMGGGASAAELMVHRRNLQEWVPGLLDGLYELVVSEADKKLVNGDPDGDPRWREWLDPEWRLRAQFHEAMHFLSVSLLHFDKAVKAADKAVKATDTEVNAEDDGKKTEWGERAKRAASICLRGAELLHKAAENYFPDVLAGKKA